MMPFEVWLVKKGKMKFKILLISLVLTLRSVEECPSSKEKTKEKTTTEPTTTTTEKVSRNTTKSLTDIWQQSFHI